MGCELTLGMFVHTSPGNGSSAVSAVNWSGVRHKQTLLQRYLRGLLASDTADFGCMLYNVCCTSTMQQVMFPTSFHDDTHAKTGKARHGEACMTCLVSCDYDLMTCCNL